MRQCGRLRTNVVAIGVFAAMRRALETRSWPLSARIIDVCLPWVYLNRVRQCGSSNNRYGLSRRPIDNADEYFIQTNDQPIRNLKFPYRDFQFRDASSSTRIDGIGTTANQRCPPNSVLYTHMKQVDRPRRRQSSPQSVKLYGVSSSPPNCPPRQRRLEAGKEVSREGPKSSNETIDNQFLVGNKRITITNAANGTVKCQ